MKMMVTQIVNGDKFKIISPIWCNVSVSSEDAMIMAANGYYSVFGGYTLWIGDRATWGGVLEGHMPIKDSWPKVCDLIDRINRGGT